MVGNIFCSKIRYDYTMRKDFYGPKKTFLFLSLTIEKLLKILTSKNAWMQKIVGVFHG